MPYAHSIGKYLHYLRHLHQKKNELKFRQSSGGISQKVEVLSPLPCKYLHFKTYKTTLKLAKVEVVEMVEIFSVYLVNDAVEILREGSAGKIESEIFAIAQKPKNKVTIGKRTSTKD